MFRVSVCFCLLVAVFASGAFAQVQRPAAATAAANCTNNQERLVSKRYLAAVHPAEKQCLAQQIHISRSKLRYYQNPSHRWQLAPRYAKWWHVPGEKRRSLARLARTQLRIHRQLLAKLEVRYHALEVTQALTSQFHCIHRYEGAWDANTGNGYYGGLQMDRDFQRSYGKEFLARWGTADNWPVWAQLTAGMRAYASGRGFGPWPNTARYCGFSTASVSPLSIEV